MCSDESKYITRCGSKSQALFYYIVLRVFMIKYKLAGTLKNLIPYLFLLGIGLLSTCHAQPLDSPALAEKKQMLLWDLQNGTDDSKIKALRIIRHRAHIPEAIPYLEKNIWDQGRESVLLTLDILTYYKSPKGIPFTYQFLASIDSLNKQQRLSKKELAELRLNATNFLFQAGNYSTVTYVFDIIDLNKPKAVPNIYKTLDEIIKHVPEFEKPARDELTRIVRETNSKDRIWALQVLEDHYGASEVPLIKQIFKTTTDEELRSQATELLLKHKDNETKDLLYERLVTDTKEYQDYAGLILQNYPNPYIYEWLSKSLNIIKHTGIQTTATIDCFKPPEPDAGMPVLQIICALRNLVDTSYGYGWINNATFVSELKTIVTSSMNKLLKDDSIGCTMDIQNFSRVINKAYGDTARINRLVYTQGYNFLNTYGSYILDRLPPYIPGTSKLIVCVPSRVDPGTETFTLKIFGKRFTRGSKVWFGDSVRTSTFLSDSLMTIKITVNDTVYPQFYDVRVQYTESPSAYSDKTIFAIQRKDSKAVGYCGGSWDGW